MIDLHCHSTASDGSLTPKQLASAAQEAGLAACAICDHDTLAGVHDFIEETSASCQLLAGIEISCAWYSATLHLLGLFVDPDNAVLAALVEEIQENRSGRNARLLERLQRVGCELDMADVETFAAGDVIGRPHFAAALVAAGICENLQHAYRDYLSDARLRDLPRWHVLPEKAIEAIHSAGGIASWAHPTGINKPPLSRVRRTARTLRSKGLDAIEAYYSSYSESQHVEMIRLASELGLRITGGSDFHGEHSPGICLGRGKGALCVPDELLAQFSHELGA